MSANPRVPMQGLSQVRAEILMNHWEKDVLHFLLYFKATIFSLVFGLKALHTLRLQDLRIPPDYSQMFHGTTTRSILKETSWTGSVLMQQKQYFFNSNQLGLFQWFCMPRIVIIYLDTTYTFQSDNYSANSLTEALADHVCLNHWSTYSL